MSPKYVAGHGSHGAKLMIVSETPKNDYANRELERFLVEDCSIPLSACYFTSIIKYQLESSEYKPFLEQSVKDLWEEIHTFEPNCILALGELALSTLTGRRKLLTWRGSILQSVEGIPKVVATYHPCNINYSQDNADIEGAPVTKYVYKWVIKSDFKRGYSQSLFKDTRLPQRTLSVCNNSRQFREFLERSNLTNPLSVDIEASRCIPNCIGLSFDKREAISVPLFNRLSYINYDGIPAYDLAFIWKDIADLLRNPETRVIGQNFKYDKDKIFRLGFTVSNLWGDTMLLAHAVNPEFPSKGLAFLQSLYTEEPYHKDEGKEFDPKRDDFKKLLLYNAKDAAVTLELHEEMYKELEEKGLTDYYHRNLMPRVKFYMDMEAKGFRVSYEKREYLLEKYMLLFDTVHKRIENNVGHEINVASTPQVCNLLYNELKLPKRFKTTKIPGGKKVKSLTADEDTIIALMANNAKTDKIKNILSDILEERKIRKTISTYILAKPDYDGRMRTSYNIVGAETDRTSTSNISAPIRPEKSMGLGFQTLTKHGEIGADICEMFIPDDGYIFVNADLDQAEARVVFVLAEEWGILNELATGKFDMHWQGAKWIFPELPSMIDCLTINKDDMRRFMGKTLRHAGHLGMKKHTHMVQVNTDSKKYGYDIKISEWKAGKNLEAFHANCPNIRGVFHDTIRLALKSSRTMEGPILIGPDGEPFKHGRWRMFFERDGDALDREAFSEIPQHTISNQTKIAGMRIKSRLPWVDFILEGHDALLAQIKEGDVDEYVAVAREELQRPIYFGNEGATFKRDYSLVVPASFSTGYDYKNMKKLKGV